MMGMELFDEPSSFGAPDLLGPVIIEFFGEVGRYQRSAPGMAGLPRDTGVTVDCIIEISEP